MGDEINGGKPGIFAYVTPDGKYLLYTSQKVPYLTYNGDELNYKELVGMLNRPQNGSGDIYWVDAKIIEELKPKDLKKRKNK